MRHCLILTSEYPPFILGGIGRYVHELATRLHHRIRVSVLLVPTYRRFESDDESATTRLLSTDSGAPDVTMVDDSYQNVLSVADVTVGFESVEAVANSLARRIILENDTSPPTHLFVQDYALAPVAAALQGLLPTVRVVAACHLPVFAGFTYFDKPVGDAIHQVLEAKLVNLAERVVVPSAFAANVLAITHNVTPDKLAVLALGVERSAAVAPPPIGPLRLLAIGRATEQKGYHFLFDALRQLVRRDARVRLTVLTGMDDNTRVIALAHAHGVASNVDVAAPIAPDAIWSLIDRHHLLVTTSLYETFGLAVLEAMASGRPTIGFAVGALPELWGPALCAEFGTPVGAVDALVTRIGSLADDLERCQRLGQAAFCRAKAFSWETHVVQLAACLETPEVASGGRSWR